MVQCNNKSESRAYNTEARKMIKKFLDEGVYPREAEIRKLLHEYNIKHTNSVIRDTIYGWKKVNNKKDDKEISPAIKQIQSLVSEINKVVLSLEKENQYNRAIIKSQKEQIDILENRASHYRDEYNKERLRNQGNE